MIVKVTVPFVVGSQEMVKGLLITMASMAVNGLVCAAAIRRSRATRNG